MTRRRRLVDVEDSPNIERPARHEGIASRQCEPYQLSDLWQSAYNVGLSKMRSRKSLDKAALLSDDSKIGFDAARGDLRRQFFDSLFSNGRFLQLNNL